MMILRKGGVAAMTTEWQETLVDKQVTYTLEVSGKIILIENVPARVNEETGEQFFSPSIVERLQQMVLAKGKPDYFVEIPVYNYASDVA